MVRIDRFGVFDDILKWGAVILAGGDLVIFKRLLFIVQLVADQYPAVYFPLLRGGQCFPVSARRLLHPPYICDVIYMSEKVHVLGHYCKRVRKFRRGHDLRLFRHFAANVKVAYFQLSSKNLVDQYHLHRLDRFAPSRKPDREISRPEVVP